MLKRGQSMPVRVCGRIEDLPAPSLPEVAVAGRSNVGKSSLLNVLLGQKAAHISRTPGKTRTINFYDTGRGFLLVDLPGYGFARVSKTVKEAWGQLVERYLAGRKNLLGLLLLIDARHPPTALDLQMRQWLEAYGIRTLYVATKADQVSRGTHRAIVQRLREELGLDPLAPIQIVSSRTGEGREALRQSIQDLLLDAPGRRS